MLQIVERWLYYETSIKVFVNYIEVKVVVTFIDGSQVFGLIWHDGWNFTRFNLVVKVSYRGVQVSQWTESENQTELNYLNLNQFIKNENQTVFKEVNRTNVAGI